jgi:hypothetical protein
MRCQHPARIADLIRAGAPACWAKSTGHLLGPPATPRYRQARKEISYQAAPATAAGRSVVHRVTIEHA